MKTLLDIPQEIIYVINNFQTIYEIIRLYLVSKLHHKYLISKQEHFAIKLVIHINNVLKKLPYRFSPKQYVLFRKNYFDNIPSGINNIYTYLKWNFIIRKLLMYYNLSFINDTVIVSSRGTHTIYQICKLTIDIIDRIKDRNHYYYYNYSRNDSTVLRSLASERNLTELSKNWYHQLEYNQFCNLAYELSIML